MPCAARLWDQDWFEDPVWRAERVNAINAHFITAFLDRYVRGRGQSRQLPERAGARCGCGNVACNGYLALRRFQSGANGDSVWKGFQRSHAAGLELAERPGRTRTESRAARRCAPPCGRPDSARSAIN